MTAPRVAPFKMPAERRFLCDGCGRRRPSSEASVRDRKVLCRPCAKAADRKAGSQ